MSSLPETGVEENKLWKGVSFVWDHDCSSCLRYFTGMLIASFLFNLFLTIFDIISCVCYLKLRSIMFLFHGLIVYIVPVYW